jgi:hypothetical protein
MLNYSNELGKLSEESGSRSNSNPKALISAKNEKQIVEIMLKKITSLYGYDSITSNFMSFLKKHRREVFLYLKDPMVEKTSDKTEQHFSVQRWLFNHSFKIKKDY